MTECYQSSSCAYGMRWCDFEYEYDESSLDTKLESFGR